VALKGNETFAYDIVAAKNIARQAEMAAGLFFVLD